MHYALDSLVFQVEKEISQHESKIGNETVIKLKEVLDSAKETLKGSDIHEMKTAYDNLTSLWHAAAQQLYQEAASSHHHSGTGNSSYTEYSGGTPEGGASYAPNSSGQDSNTNSVDADFEVVN